MKRVWLLPAIAAALGGCAAAPEGARTAPEAWAHPPTVSNCGSTDGRFEEAGAPAPANSQAGMQSFAWPAMGSLSAMVRTGANGMRYGDFATVSIEIVDGSPRFKAFNREGAEIPLPAREWWCDGKSLTTRAVLGNADANASPTSSLPKRRDESVLRLWRAADGSLIAEQTLEGITPGRWGSSSNHRPLTRSYFRFLPVVTKAN